MTVGLDPRAAALAAIRRVDEGAWSTVAVPEAIADLADPRDRSLAAHLAHGTVRWRGSLDWALGHALSRSLHDVEEVLHPILRLGAFQLRHSRVPARAAVDTSVALARAAVPPRRASGAGGFVNGVLRGLSRATDDLERELAGLPDVRRVAIATGHPDWIVEERLATGMAVGEVEALLDADNHPPGVTLRATGDRDALMTELRDLGIDATPTALADAGVRAPGGDPRALAAVAEGRAVPQDEASMLVGAAAGVVPGDLVVDLCAAPGGKATDLARRTGPDGRVVAVDLHQHRAAMVTEAARRLDLPIEVVVGDGLEVDLPTDADVVLVDAPCTGLGVGRRRPEVRWRRSPHDIANLAPLQVQLVERGLGLLRPGGRLTYAVCTWTAAETVGVVDAVERSTDRSLDRVNMRQLRPDRDDTDGMFHVTWEIS